MKEEIAENALVILLQATAMFFNAAVVFTKSNSKLGIISIGMVTNAHTPQNSG